MIKNKEKILQKQCEDLARYYNISFIRIPDAVYKYIFGNKNIPVHIKVLVSNFIKSVPDMTLLFKNGKYACVELKAEKGRLTKGQKNFRKIIGDDNYYIVKDIETFLSIIKKYNGFGVDK